MGKICCILLLSHTLDLLVYLIIYMCLQFMYIKSSNILSKDEKYLLELLQLLIHIYQNKSFKNSVPLNCNFG